MTGPDVKEVHNRLRKLFKKRIPSGEMIARAAIERAISARREHPEWIKSNFSDLVESVQIDAYNDYLAAEQVAGSLAISKVFRGLGIDLESPDDVFRVLGQYFHSLDRFFLGLTQGRRPRAGKTFEYLIRALFETLDYPFTSQPVINGQPDFILPSVEHFDREPMDAIIFTVKRTCRERWRQIVTEGTRGLGFFLATIDEQVSARDLGEMLQSRIRLVVPARLKTDNSVYRTAGNVISFEQFFEYHLDPAMTRWKAKRVIP